MFQVRVSEKEYRVTFQHTQTEPFLGLKGMTQCTLWDGEKIVNKAASFCSKADNFSKNIGRKIALTRVLETVPFDRETRALFWQAYCQARGNKW